MKSFGEIQPLKKTSEEILFNSNKTSVYHVYHAVRLEIISIYNLGCNVYQYNFSTHNSYSGKNRLRLIHCSDPNIQNDIENFINQSWEPGLEGTRKIHGTIEFRVGNS